MLGRHVKERVDRFLLGEKGPVQNQKSQKSLSGGSRAVTEHLSPEEIAKQRKAEMLESIRNANRQTNVRTSSDPTQQKCR